MNINHNFLNPLDTTTNGSGSTSNAGSAAAPSNTLDANSFITLLTTELQTQDPLNPLDPTQFVDQLTNLNSLQQLIQIRTDLDSLSGSTSGTTSGTGSGSSGSNSPATAAIGATAPSLSGPSSTLAHLASALGAQNGAPASTSLASLQSLLGNSISAAPSAAARFYSKLGSLSQLF